MENRIILKGMSLSEAFEAIEREFNSLNLGSNEEFILSSIKLLEEKVKGLKDLESTVSKLEKFITEQKGLNKEIFKMLNDE